MKIDIITLFPEMYEGPFKHSIVKRAQDKSLLQINLHNLRKWGIGKRKTVDDRPYGGGAGMVLMVEPIYKALKELKKENTKVILLTPQGNKYNQKMAEGLVKNKHLILISGHYEGFDERIRKELIDQEISIGDYVLTGGEIPSMVIVDSLVRLIPGVLGKDSSSEIESFSKEGFLEYPQYTHPETFMKHKVPEILLSGNHKKIEEWRDKKAKEKTKKVRPDLLET